MSNSVATSGSSESKQSCVFYTTSISSSMLVFFKALQTCGIAALLASFQFERGSGTPIKLVFLKKPSVFDLARSKPSPYAHPPAGDTEGWKPLISAMYRAFNPGQLARIDEILTKYHMREFWLYRALVGVWCYRDAKHTSLKESGDYFNISDHTNRRTKLAPTRLLPANACRICGEVGHWGN